MIRRLLGKLGSWVIGASVILATVLSAYLYGTNRGKRSATQRNDLERQKERVDELSKALTNAQIRNDIESKNNSRSDGSVERLRNKWSRPDNKP